MPEIVTRGNLPHWYKPGFCHFVTYRLAGSIPQQLIQQWREEREAQLRRVPPRGVALGMHRQRAHKRFFAKYDSYLDKSRGTRFLADARVAAIVRENLHHHQGKLYDLIAYCVMPTHVHLLIRPYDVGVDNAGSVVLGEVYDDVGGIVGERVSAELTDDAGSVVYDLAGDAGSVVYGDELADGGSPLARIMHSLKSYTATRANEILRRSGAFWQRESYDHWARDVEELERIASYIVLNPVRAGLCAAPTEWVFSSAHDTYVRDQSSHGILHNWRG
jgi:putative DNA methylase